MTVPSQAQFHRPVLEILAEAESRLTIRRIMDLAAIRLSLTPSDKQEQEANGALKWEKRVRWAVHYLKDFGEFVHSPEYRQYQITNAGREFLGAHDGDITIKRLKEIKAKLSEQSPATMVVQAEEPQPTDMPDHLPVSDAVDPQSEAALDDADANPDDLIQTGYQQLQVRLAQEMFESVAAVTPGKFENLVVDLLVKMGYGRGRAVGRSGDGGIDGIINQDALGLEKVYVQAKRWANQVPPAEIQKFAGSLDTFGATKGVFITTSTFSNAARQTAQAISAGNKFIRLVDGNELAQLMIRHGVGVVTDYTYEIKKLDENYFADEV